MALERKVERKVGVEHKPPNPPAVAVSAVAATAAADLLCFGLSERREFRNDALLLLLLLIICIYRKNE